MTPSPQPPQAPQVLDYKTKVALEGLPKHLQGRILNEVPDENRTVFCAFLADMVNVENARPNTKLMYAKNLLYLFRSVNHKLINLITRDDILNYLHTLRRSAALDPDEKWINTHNNRSVMYQKFFKWLHYPELSPKERKTPDIVKDLPVYKKKERTNVKAKDLWHPQEDAIFLSYCDDPRVQLYHMMSLDTSGRPHELLALRIGDVKIKFAGEKMYAEIEVGRGGKTKSRTVPLIISLPYYKALLAVHPEPNNPQAYIFRNQGEGAKYRNKTITPHALAGLYRRLKVRDFPKLLERADIPPEEKSKIQDMLQKPWNPYIRRHTSLTEKAKILNEYSLRLHAGWTKTSKMVEVYTHELGGESSAALLEAYGIMPKESNVMNVLQPRQCSNCNEPNKRDAQYCMKCQFPMNFEAYNKAKEDQQNAIRSMVLDVIQDMKDGIYDGISPK